MDKYLTTLTPFFEHPSKIFLIRELARILKMNHTTLRTQLNYYVKEEILVKKKQTLYDGFAANIKSKKFLNIKLYHNLESLRESTVAVYLERELDYPIIVLFGSYAQAIDDEQSDIDLCIITNIKKEITLELFEKKLKKSLNIHRFTKNEWNLLKKKNPQLINNIINGITLSGQLEVL